MPGNVYCLPVAGRRLLFAPLSNMAAVVNSPAADVVRGVLCDGKPVPADLPWGRLVTEISADAPPPAVPTGPAQPPFLGLILTRGCNMACRYCDFAADRGVEAMDPELICQILAGWVAWVHAGGGKRLNLHFFGGEPFVQPDLVEIAVHRTRYLAGRHDLALRVEASTNGLLGERMLAFVQDHFDTIVLSLDGQAEDHDWHRPLRNGVGSFREVWSTAQALAESPVELCIRCCVSQANVGRMADTTRWLCQALHPDSITFEPMKPTPEAEAVGLRPPAPLAFAREFVAAARIAGTAGVGCVYSPLFDRPRLTFCPVGRDTFIVAPDRSVRSCYLRRQDWEARGMDLRIGKVAPDGQLAIDPAAIQRLRELAANRARCARCFCRWSCAGGCLVTETPPGHSLAYTDFCRLTRLVQACMLLEKLGLADQADALLADEEAAARLWEHADDRLKGGG